MNIYPMWWDSTITIFNKYTDSVTKKISWYRRTVPNCFWKYVGEQVSVGDTILDTNHTICRIPKSDEFMIAYKWNTLSNDERDKFFTLDVGDILVNGDVDDEIDEYVSGKRSSDFLTKYRKFYDCMVVEHISINVGAGRHSEHYAVKGL